ncbi:hypothetical protein Acr_17g0000630 [Actinidia rufa]|uniref:Uncharacterized protein n=1 Tax=Actinidia rufa TaxID=165716 RepID=A0A7J0G0N6_9ERIC|nr:hypothetical protein Acr_17g0000630 [Actinidia rufa]
MDGIHSRVHLVEYQSGAIDMGPLHTTSGFLHGWDCSAALLGCFYSSWTKSFSLTQHREPPENSRYSVLIPPSISRVARLKSGQITVWTYPIQELIAHYQHEVLKGSRHPIIRPGHRANPWVEDKTWLGFALASIVGLVCPLAEIPIMKLFHLWYYPQANIELFGQIENSATGITICNVWKLQSFLTPTIAFNACSQVVTPCGAIFRDSSVGEFIMIEFLKPSFRAEGSIHDKFSMSPARFNSNTDDVLS